MPFYMLFVCFSFLWAHVYGNVVHIDCDAFSIDEVSEYSVHHCLEGC